MNLISSVICYYIESSYECYYRERFSAGKFAARAAGYNRERVTIESVIVESADCIRKDNRSRV
jgi:hypothetical protein